jgi:hypothetical protein
VYYVVYPQRNPKCCPSILARFGLPQCGHKFQGSFGAHGYLRFLLLVVPLFLTTRAAVNCCGVLAIILLGLVTEFAILLEVFGLP